MHEAELATRVLDTLRRIAAERKSRVLEANLKVGEINEPSSLHLWLKKLGGNDFRYTKFKITQVPITIKCTKCGYSGDAKSIDTHLPDPKLGIACPKCGGYDLSITTGQELEIVDVKLEEGPKCLKRKSR
jgi:Zn finger protein HypA/HybF involved in hydrogenase expression